MEVCYVQMAYPSLFHCMVLTYFYSSEPILGRPNLDFSYSDDALRRRSFFEPHWPFAQKF